MVNVYTIKLWSMNNKKYDFVYYFSFDVHLCDISDIWFYSKRPILIFSIDNILVNT